MTIYLLDKGGYCVIDFNGFFIREDFEHGEGELKLNAYPPTFRVFNPKWTGEIIEDDEGNITVGEGEWVEGATQEEIDELTKPQPQVPTEIDLLQAQVQAGSDYVDFLEEVVVELIQEVYQ